MKNTVIANRKNTDWPIIKKYFEDRGVDTNDSTGYCREDKGHDLFYYGVIDGEFDCHTLKEAQQANAKILEVSDIDKEFKVGDVVVLTSNECDLETTGSNDKNIPINTPLEVVDVTKSDIFKNCDWLRFKGYSDNGVTSNQARHATPEEINQYKNISDTVTLPKSFVIEAHKDACSDWKKRIEEVVPELFPKELKGWCKSKNNPLWIAYFEGEKFIYGFDGYGDWFDTPKRRHKGINDFAVDESQVFEALKNEAVKRGFKEGVEFRRVNSISGKVEKDSRDTLYSDFELTKKGLLCGVDYIFYKGIWAEIIENPIPKKLQSLIDEIGKEEIIKMLK